jgi:hypothetical protein
MRSHFAVRAGVLLQLMIDKFVGFMSDDEDGPSDGVRTPRQIDSGLTFRKRSVGPFGFRVRPHRLHKLMPRLY